jgi:hypothetical protein
MNRTTWKIPSEVLQMLRNKSDPKSEISEKDFLAETIYTSETLEKEKGICIDINYENFDAFAVSTFILSGAIRKYVILYLTK